MQEGLHEGYLQPGHPTTPTGCPFLAFTCLTDRVSTRCWYVGLGLGSKSNWENSTAWVKSAGGGICTRAEGNHLSQGQGFAEGSAPLPPPEENFWPRTPLPCCFLAGASLRGDGYSSRLLPMPLASIHGYRRALCNSQSRLCFCSLDLSPADFPPQPSFP